MYNIIWWIFQELWILLGGCLTVKNQWGLLTGDDGGGFPHSYTYANRMVLSRVLQRKPQRNVRTMLMTQLCKNSSSSSTTLSIFMSFPLTHSCIDLNSNILQFHQFKSSKLTRQQI